MNKIHFILAGILLLLGGCLLTACAEDEAWQLGVDGYVYVAEPSVLCSLFEEDMKNAENFYVSGSYLYFTTQQSGSLPALKRITMNEEGEFVSCNEIAAIAGLSCFTADSEGNIYYCTFASGIGTLYKISGNGTLLFQTDFPGINAATQFLPYSYDCLAVDSQGVIYLLADDGIHLVDAEGSKLGLISIEEFGEATLSPIKYLMRDANDQIYCVIRDGRRKVLEITPGKSPQISEISALNDRSTEELFMTSIGLLEKNSDDTLYLYDENTASMTAILRWQDSNLISSQIQDVVALSEDELLVPYGDSSSGYQLLSLKRTPVSDLPEKELIVLATLFPTQELKIAVAAFNLENEHYHVMLESFGADPFGQNKDEALVRLDASLLTSPAPDLLDLSDLDISKYAAKEILRDLTDLLENSSTLKKEDYLDNLLESYTINGKLVCIPKRFQLYTMFGRKQQLSSIKEGYSSEKLFQLTPEDKIHTIVGGLDLADMLDTFFSYEYLSKYIDWESGECCFQSDSFGNLLKWVKLHVKEDEEPIYGYVPEDVMMTNVVLDDFTDMLVLKERLQGEEAILIGFPSEKSVTLHVAEALDSIAIVENSSRQEGARAFWEYYMTRESNISYYNGGFPTQKSLLESLAVEAETPFYIRDEAGNILLNADGSYWTHFKGYIYVTSEPIEYDFVSQELTHDLLKAIESADFTPRSDIENEIITIISEEAMYYFHDNKTLEVVLEIIQNRISNLVQERQ